MKIYVSPNLCDIANKLAGADDTVIVCDNLIEDTWKVEGVDLPSTGGIDAKTHPKMIGCPDCGMEIEEDEECICQQVHTWCPDCKTLDGCYCDSAYEDYRDRQRGW